MGYERSQLLEDTRYDLIRENTNELSSACPPVKALGLIREEAPLTGNTSGIEASIVACYFFNDSSISALWLSRTLSFFLRSDISFLILRNSACFLTFTK